MSVKRNNDGVKRGYHSPRREEQARATRKAILDAAHELFLAHGYADTSIAAVAERARVSRQTVYDAFGDKASLFFALGERILARQDEPGPVPESVAWRRLHAEPDAAERIRQAARFSREAWEHGMLEFESMLFDAAASDGRIEPLAREAKKRKRETSRGLAPLVFRREDLRDGISFEDVVDMMDAIDSAAVVRLLVEERGWSYDKFERWLADLMERLLLRHPV